MRNIDGPDSSGGEFLAARAVVEFTPVGLCSTCNNSTTCVHREYRGRDAQFCEMFDCSNGASHPPSVGLVTPTMRDASEQAGLKGLCVNCENRETCTLPRAETGVWHCEEYR